MCCGRDESLADSAGEFNYNVEGHQKDYTLCYYIFLNS